MNTFVKAVVKSGVSFQLKAMFVRQPVCTCSKAESLELLKPYIKVSVLATLSKNLSMLYIFFFIFINYSTKLMVLSTQNAAIFTD